MGKLKYFFILTLLISCSDNESVIKIKNQTDIGKTIASEYKDFSNWSFEDFQKKQSYSHQVKDEVNKDVGFILLDNSFSPKKAYKEMKNGGKRRLINWSKIVLKETRNKFKKQNQVRHIGKISGDVYIMYEITCYEPEGNNTFAFMPLFRFNGQEYELLCMSFDW